jgi:hypothetical protein
LRSVFYGQEGRRSRLWLKMKRAGFHDGWERPPAK